MPEIKDEGKRFSHAYLVRSEPTSDSARMRKRLAVIASNFPDEYGLTTTLEMELGISVSGWSSFYLKSELRDVLDSVTVIYRDLYGRGGRPMPSGAWTALVNRIFREENVPYLVGSNGGVHYSHDAEFSHNISSTIAAIQGPRYKNIQVEFAQVQGALDAVPPNGKDAVRKTFTALEGMFRLMFPRAPRLGTAEARSNISPLIASVYGVRATDQRAAEKMLASFADWIDAAHFYRHEHGQAEVAQPQIGLAIGIVSTGAAYLRWLAELDSRLISS